MKLHKYKNVIFNRTIYSESIYNIGLHDMIDYDKDEIATIDNSSNYNCMLNRVFGSEFMISLPSISRRSDVFILKDRSHQIPFDLNYICDNGYSVSNSRKGGEEMNKILTTLQDSASSTAKTGVNNLKDKVLKYGLKTAKNHFGKEIFLSIYDLSLESVVELTKFLISLIGDKDKFISIDDFNNCNNKFFYLMNANLDRVIKLRNDTYMVLKTGRACNDFNELTDIVNSTNNSTPTKIGVYIYVFGKKMYRYTQKIEKIIKMESSDILKYSISALSNKTELNFTSYASKHKNRNIDTLFFENHTKETICSHIDTFLKNKPIYESRDLLYKTGILLYGEPGTGKSSLCGALATKYKIDICIIDMGTFDMLDVTRLTEALNGDDRMYLIVLEDIDCIVKNREDSDVDRSDNKVINKLLQFLDSNSSPSNVIFIATTNHLDKLDSAITRAGRFDLKVEVGGIEEDTAIQMCKSFELNNSDTKDIINSIKKDSEFPVNQSFLQSKILKRIKKNINAVG